MTVIKRFTRMKQLMPKVRCLATEFLEGLTTVERMAAFRVFYPETALGKVFA